MAHTRHSRRRVAELTHMPRRERCLTAGFGCAWRRAGDRRVSVADSFLADLGQPAGGEQISHLSDRPQAEPVGGDGERGHGLGITEPDDRSPGWPDYPCQLPERELKVVDEVDGVDRDERIQ